MPTIKEGKNYLIRHTEGHGSIEILKKVTKGGRIFADRVLYDVNEEGDKAFKEAVKKAESRIKELVAEDREEEKIVNDEV